MNRFYQVLASIYLYNEHKGFTELEKLVQAIEKHFPTEKDFLKAVKKHAADEKKHYKLFCGYFKKTKTQPFQINKTMGYIDLFIKKIFKTDLEDLDHEKILSDKNQFFKLCRLIMMTEFRGMKQVKQILKISWIQNNPYLKKTFEIIERDEPSHCLPYQKWLKKQNQHLPGLKEKLIDLWIHYSILFIKFPFLYLNLALSHKETSQNIKC